MTTSEEAIDSALADSGGGGSGGIPYFSSSYDSRLGQWFGGFFTGAMRLRGQTQRDGTPVMWEAGKCPVGLEGQQRQELVITLYCPEESRDINNPLDDGTRLLTIKKQDSHIEDSEYSALLAALEAAGVGVSMRRGGRLMMLHNGHRQGDTNRRKVWKAHYTPPTPEAITMLDNLLPAGTAAAMVQPDSHSSPSAHTSPSVASAPPPPNYGTPQSTATSIPPPQAPVAAAANGRVSQSAAPPLPAPAPTGPGEPPVPGARHNGAAWYVPNAAGTDWVLYVPPQVTAPQLPPLPPPPANANSPFIPPAQQEGPPF